MINIKQNIMNLVYYYKKLERIKIHYNLQKML